MRYEVFKCNAFFHVILVLCVSVISQYTKTTHNNYVYRKKTHHRVFTAMTSWKLAYLYNGLCTEDTLAFLWQGINSKLFIQWSDYIMAMEQCSVRAFWCLFNTNKATAGLTSDYQKYTLMSYIDLGVTHLNKNTHQRVIHRKYSTRKGWGWLVWCFYEVARNSTMDFRLTGLNIAFSAFWVGRGKIFHDHASHESRNIRKIIIIANH